MGLLHIYCGDGKGKTTASLGLAIRAAGAGMKVCFVQFAKGGETSEHDSLKLIPNITVVRCDRKYGFYNEMTDSDKKEITLNHNKLIDLAFKSDTDMIILDEFNFVYEYGLIDKNTAKQLILNGKANKEIILTGRNPAEVFISAADYISEIKAVKHPYDKGITARKGIEY